MAKSYIGHIGTKTVKQLRQKLGLTKEQFARKIGFHPQSIGRWERGEHAMKHIARKAIWNHFQDEIKSIRSSSAKTPSQHAKSSSPKGKAIGPRIILNPQGRGIRIIIDILPM